MQHKMLQQILQQSAAVTCICVTRIRTPKKKKKEQEKKPKFAIFFMYFVQKINEKKKQIKSRVCTLQLCQFYFYRPQQPKKSRNFRTKRKENTTSTTKARKALKQEK